MAKKSSPQLQPPDNDGLIMPDVGPWSEHKHHFLQRYLDAFTTSMRDKPWSGLHYVDLFAGAGIERLKNTAKLSWGSPLIAAQMRYPFKRLHLCEKEPQKHDALRSRIRRFRADSQVLLGDGNERVREILAAIPQDSLSIAFLDPYGLHLDFETVRQLAERRMDLIVFFPDRLDALRNCDYVYRDNPNSNLDRFLGTAEWREPLDNAPGDQWAEVLRKIYTTQLRKLGYFGPELERIYWGATHPLYLLLFFSKHELGLDLWRRVSQKKPDNQTSFDFGNPPS